MNVFRIGTRGSPLALAQAYETRARLMATHGLPEENFAIDIISVMGDRIQDRPLSEVGGKSLFTKEIEEALLSGRIDMAVHSSKDMPTTLPPGLELSAFLPREDPRDAFVSSAGRRLAALPGGATIGSSSLRRQALIRRMRPDLVVVPLRGNVQTRLRKIDEGVADGTMLAMSGLKRVSLEHVVTEILPLDQFPPAPGQGAICIESRSRDHRVATLVAAIHHSATGYALACERAFLRALDGSCRTPIAGYARIETGTLYFNGMILTPDGEQSYEIEASGPVADAPLLGRTAGEEVREKACPALFDNWNQQNGFLNRLERTG